MIREEVFQATSEVGDRTSRDDAFEPLLAPFRWAQDEGRITVMHLVH